MPTAASDPAKPLARRVFISYARKDGRDVAHGLRDLLRNQGFEVWLDTDGGRIPGGTSWSKRIEQALDACDVLIAVLTEGSFVSEVCRAEQIWVLDRGKAVIPVVAVPGAPVPIHLFSKQRRKYPEEQTALIEDLGAEINAEPTAAPRPLRYDTVPNLPLNHVMREQALADLRDLVFTEGAGPNIAVTALAGMGGIGKTVLATALCRDHVVQRAFPDGIAWITIGREWDGDFVTRMREVARALGDSLEGYDSPLACENRYRTILRDKAALVVVDDVWSLDYLKPLLVDAPRSRLLFTTRDGSIAKAVTDRRYFAQLLSNAEANDLLARWAGISAAELPPEANRVVDQCGDLALAVAQVGASLRDLSPDEWRDTLDALERADISAIEDRLPSGQTSFFKSLAVSVVALPDQMGQRYLKLAVLLEDLPAPLAVLRTLWKVDGAEARRTARCFVDRSLGRWEDAADPSRGIRLHDLQLDYVRARFVDSAALKLIHGAMRLSSNVITQRPEEFASQMLGRLQSAEATGAMVEFTKELAEGAPRPWLKPLRPCLHPSGTNLIRTLVGHTDVVRGVAVTAPEGRRAVSGSADGTLKVWDLESGEELRTIAGHSAAVSGVALAAQGRWIVSASGDRTLKVWDLESGRHLLTLEGHSDRVYGVAVTADGHRVVSASGDQTLRIWDLHSGRELRSLVGHSNVVTGVATTPDGRAVSASWDNTLKIWDLEEGLELNTLVGHGLHVTGVAVTADGRRAVSASWDRTLKVWDLRTGKELSTLVGHSGWIEGVAVTPDGRRAVSASWDDSLKIWDLDSGLELRTLTGHSGRVTRVAVTADGRRAVSASYDKTLNVWDLDSDQAMGSLPGHKAAVVTSVAATADGQRVVFASGDSTVNVWDLRSGLAPVALAGHAKSVYSVAVTADGERAVSGSGDKTLKVWSLRRFEELRTLAGHTAYVSSVAVTADGRAVSASWDKTLRVWDLDGGEELCTMTGHADSVYGVAVAPDGRRAISASLDNTLKVWDLHNFKEVQTLVGHSAFVTVVVLTPDGQRAVSASLDNTIKVWDLENGQELRTLTGHTDAVYGVAVAADGRRIVSASRDKTLKLWDLESGQAVAGFTCDGGVKCCTFAGWDQIIAGDFGGRLYWLRLET